MNLYIPIQTTNESGQQHRQRRRHHQALPKKTSIHFLYENIFGKFFFNEEPYSIWTCCSNPYSDSKVVSIAQNDPEWMEDEDKSTYVKSIPRCKVYRGLLIQGYLISPKFLRSLDSLTIRSNDLFICSYPRSGTTWTEEIVSAIASKMDNEFMSKPVHDRVIHLEVGRTFGQNRYLKSLKSPRILSTHLPYSHCPEQLKSLKCKVIYILRNPKDQAVSYYHFHHTAMYLGSKEWPFDQFIQFYLKGIMCYGSWFDHVAGWLTAAIEYPESILVISYEELQVNLPSMIKLIASFLDTQLTDEVIHSIVKHCQFNSMKNNPAANREETPLSDIFKASKFMRKGLIGDWKNYFNQIQRKLIDETFNSKLGHFKLNLPSDFGEAVNMLKINKLRVFDSNVNYNQQQQQLNHFDQFNSTESLNHPSIVVNTQPNQLVNSLPVTSVYINSEKINYEQVNEQLVSEEVTFHEINLNDEFDCHNNLLIGYRKRALQPNLSQIAEETTIHGEGKCQLMSTSTEEQNETDELNGQVNYIESHKERSESNSSEGKIDTHQLTSDTIDSNENVTHNVECNSIGHGNYPIDETIKGDLVTSNDSKCNQSTINLDCDREHLDKQVTNLTTGKSITTQLDTIEPTTETETITTTTTTTTITVTSTTIETSTSETLPLTESNGLGHLDNNFGQSHLQQLDTTTRMTMESPLVTSTVVNSSESNVNDTQSTSSPAVAVEESSDQPSPTSILTYNLDTFH